MPEMLDTTARPAGEGRMAGTQVQEPAYNRREEGDHASECAAVKQWMARITEAKKRWEPHFKQMKACMEFAAGYQWEGQQNLEDDRYRCNWVQQMVDQKVASLYAKNPEAEATRRERLVFQAWDGQIESLVQAFQRVMMGRQSGIIDVEAEVIMKDFQQGRAMEALIDKVGKTLKIVYQYQVDTSKPEFKEQMKQLVRRVITCGVGYCRPSFIRNNEPPLSSVETRHSPMDMAKRMEQLLEKGDLEESSPAHETMKSLGLSLGMSMTNPDPFELDERLEFDFPAPTSIIPDTRCRSLKEFVAARWVAQEFILPLDEANTFFGLTGDDAIKPGTDSQGVKIYSPDGEPKPSAANEGKGDPMSESLVCLYEVFDYTTKTRFFIIDGHKYFVQSPEPMFPAVSGFWQIFALTFNAHESNDQTKASPFPQSDVALVKSVQKEWNRTRDALRDQRAANAPTYLVRKGILTANDKAKLQNREPNEIIELEALPQDMPPEKAIAVLQVAAIDRAVYETQSLEQDRLLSVGQQQANIGPAQPNVTATVGTIAEQSRITVTGSNVDDLDDFLSRLAQACGEMLLQAMDEQTVKRIAGPGAVWPTMNRQEFLNSVLLRIKAASSGRPNQAIQVRNRQQIAPLLLQAGANPVAVIEDLVKTMEDNRDSLDVQKFFPVPGMPVSAGPSTPAGQPQRGGAQKSSRPAAKPTPPGPPVPLAAAP